MRNGGNAVGIAVLAGAGLVFAVALALCRAQPKELPGHGATPPPAVSERYPNAWPDPPPADVGALLDGLGPGATLRDGWRVRGVSPVVENRIAIDVEKAGIGFRVLITTKGRDPRKAPAESARYALYTVQPRPSTESLRDEDYESVLGALLDRVKKTEERVPMPSGM